MNARRGLISSLSLLILVLGCPSEPTPETPPPSQPRPYRDLGELHDAIEAARSSGDSNQSRDSDGDGIPDRIEDELGTNPQDADSDRDGLADGVELFGTGAYDPAAPLPDADRDGDIAPADPDDDGDGINDGEGVDSDGDGIANYLEYYGYSYDWLTGVFMPWDGDPAQVGYRSDPLQPSTDQDAFSDAVEVTGIGLDVSIDPPGDHPLVPAVPNIVMELIGYSVTLNEQITYEEGSSLAQGQTWNRQTERTNSHTDERNWEVGVEAGYSGGVHVVAHANYGESYSNTQSTSTSVASGGSVLSQTQWSCARCSNPTDAARLKLFVKVHNRGGAPLSNVIPTLTVKIGGLSIATFEPGNAQINMLVPGQSYPSEPGVTWVIDSIDTGAGIAPIALTMRELRALESGAPVSVAVTQLLGDVMRLDADGVWQRVGDVNEYLARCDEVSANVIIDLGDGDVVQHLVFADHSSSAPAVTLAEALRLIGADEDGVLHFLDAERHPRAVSLEGFAFAVDSPTLQQNGWTLEADGGLSAPADFDFDALRLSADSSVMVRAPRAGSAELGPEIHFAYVDSQQQEITACASDYQGVASAEVCSADGDRCLALAEELEGAGFFNGSLVEAPFDLGEPLTLVVTNLAGVSATHALGSLFEQPGPRAPIINSVSLDLPNSRVYANVESAAPSDPISAIEWVQAFHPGLPGGAVALLPVVDAYQDPHGYAADLPPTFANSNVDVVAYVDEGVFTSHRVSEAEVQIARKLGSITLAVSIDTTGEDEEWLTHAFSLDEAVGWLYFIEADDWSNAWNPAPPWDLWAWVDENHTAWLKFNAEYAHVPPGTDFADLSRAEIDALNPSLHDALQVHPYTNFGEGSILALRTSGGRYAKVRISGVSHTDEGGAVNYYRRWIGIEYVTFANPGE